MAKSYPSKEFLLDMFEYRDGVLFRKRSAQRYPAGPCLSKTNSGRARVQIEGISYYIHRLIWIMHFGEMPGDLLIDHINGAIDDNRIENLRLVTAKENQYNRRKRIAGTSKYKGVSRSSKDGRYDVIIQKNYKSIRVGRFATEEAAAVAYNKKAIELFGEHACLNEVYYRG